MADRNFGESKSEGFEKVSSEHTNSLRCLTNGGEPRSHANAAATEHQGANDGEVLGRAKQPAGRRAELLPVPAVPTELGAGLVVGYRRPHQPLMSKPL